MNTATLSTWQQLLSLPADEAYDQLADLLHLPRITAFPRPGDVRGWTVQDWLSWGKDLGFVLGPKTKHTQMIQHKMWPTVSVSPAGSSGDMRSAMNCAQDGRNSLVRFLERVRQVCRVLTQDDEQPGDALGEWLASKLTGAAGQTLLERAKTAPLSETVSQATEADRLLKRLRTYYSSTRAALLDCGCTEHAAERLIVLNKGKETWSFMGLAEQLTPVMRLLLTDHAAGENNAVLDKQKSAPPAPEPEVLGPSTVAAEHQVLSPQAAEFIDVAEEGLDQMEQSLVKQAVLMERVSQEIPEFVRTSRARQGLLYRIVNDLIDFQAKNHTFITKYEQSDLMTQLGLMQRDLVGFKTYAKGLKLALMRKTADSERAQQRAAELGIALERQSAEIAALEERVTDPKLEHTTQKLRDIRGLLEGKLDVFELVNNVDRVKKMLDALIKAAA